MHKICHISCVHRRSDGRIFKKECLSLVSAGYKVSLVVADGLGDEVLNDVHIYDVGKIDSRIKRMLFSAKRTYQKALELNCDVYHFHDPELIPYGLKLKRKGKIVVYDSHEDAVLDIAQKRWLPQAFRFLLSKLFYLYQAYSLSRFDGTITVTPHIVEKLKKHSSNVCQITNYPITDDSEIIERTNTKSSNTVCFAGGVNPTWNHDRIIQAIEPLGGVNYALAGNSSSQYLEKLQTVKGWNKVVYYGSIPHDAVGEIYRNSFAGMAIIDYKPAMGYKLGSLGNTKLFEFMQYQIPVICTNYTLWNEIIEGFHCGICVEPTDIHQIRSAIQWLLDHPEDAKKMGENGRQAVLQHYNWKSQEAILLDFYSKLLKTK